MTPDPPDPRRSARRPSAARLGAALGALAAAASAFVLPAYDGDLPGGSLPWQLGALVLALACAWWARRAPPAPEGRPAPARRLARLAAAVALLLVMVWVGGVLALWLLWPR